MLTACRTSSIVEGRLGHVHRHIARVQPVAHHEEILEAGSAVDARELRRRDAVAHDIDLAILEPQHRNGGVLAELEGDLVEIGDAWRSNPCCVRAHILARHPFHEFEGTGAHRLAPPVRAALLDLLARHDRGEVQRHGIEKGCIGTAQADFDRVVVGRLDAAQPLRLAAGQFVIAGDRGEIAGAWTLCLGIDGALEGVFHVGRRQRPAIVEFDAVVQLEAVGLAIVGDGVALGQRRDRARPCPAGSPSAGRKCRASRRNSAGRSRPVGRAW